MKTLEKFSAFNHELSKDEQKMVKGGTIGPGRDTLDPFNPSGQTTCTDIGFGPHGLSSGVAPDTRDIEP